MKMLLANTSFQLELHKYESLRNETVTVENISGFKSRLCKKNSQAMIYSNTTSVTKMSSMSVCVCVCLASNI